jgi:hypothetical protein
VTGVESKCQAAGKECGAGKSAQVSEGAVRERVRDEVESVERLVKCMRKQRGVKERD